MNRTDVIETMALISTYWPHWRIPSDRDEASAMVDAWGRLLGDLDAEAVNAAVEAYAVTGAEFAPGPGVLRKRAIELTTPRGVPLGDEAWAEVLDQIARVGYVGRPQFSHPAIEAAVAAFGWTALCESENQMVDRAHFLKMFEGIRERVTFEAVAPPSVKALVARVQTQLGLGHGDDPGDGPRHALDGLHAALPRGDEG